MNMSYNFNNDIPIYLQIVDIITNEIINGKLKSGDKIPSVREYASIFKANPNTVSKALEILEDKSLIYTERTNGKYITSDLELINSYKKEVFDKRVYSFLTELKNMGYNKDEIIKKINEVE